MKPEALAGLYDIYHQAIENSQRDPYRYGFKLPHWKKAEELLGEFNELLVSGGNRSSKTTWAATAVVKAAIAVDRADTIKSTAEAAISAKDAIQDGNYGRAALSALQVVAAKSDVLPGSKSAKEVKAETTKNVEAIVEGRLVAGSSNGFDRGQKEMAEKLGIRTVPTSGGKHAEENLLKGQVEAIGTTRTPCGPDRHDCAGQLATAGVQHSPQLDKLAKKINDAGISEPSRNRRTFAVGREPK